MKYIFSKEIFDKTQSDISIVFIKDKNLNHKWIHHKDLLKEANFKVKSEESIFLQSQRTLYIGCESFDSDEIRTLCAKAFNILKHYSYKNAKIGIYENDDCMKESIQAILEGFDLGSYEFNTYKSKPEKYSLNKIIIANEEYNNKEIDNKKVKLAFKNALAITSATNFAKDIVNTIPNDYTPVKMAEDALALSKEFENVECTIHDEKFLKKEKMNAFLAVNRASIHPARLIHLIYKPKNAQKRVIFVGKGLTYDSGGLSLKPSEHMVTMKADKSGGAAALGIIKGAALMELDVEIHAIIGATENMIGGNAYKPDDVLIARNGKSIEVRNTDAEGRLVLADCLSYAQDFKPDFLIDMATLTGACVVALGEYTTGIMGHSDELRQCFESSAKRSGELTTNLYFNKYLSKLVKSQIADISNISTSRYGGAITAGLFLDNFINEENKSKWLHLDIAGPAYSEKAWGYNQFGATGAGVRMNLYWLNKISRGNK